MEIFTQQFITLVLALAASVTAVTEMVKNLLKKVGFNMSGWFSWVVSAIIAVIPVLKYADNGISFEIILWIVTVLTANGFYLFARPNKK